MQRLLAIDDNPACAELIVRCAAKCGYDAMALHDPTEVAHMVQTWKPHIATVDLCMPQKDGIALLSLLCQAGFCGGLLIISGEYEKLRKAAGTIAAAKGMHVIADMSKPLNLVELRAILASEAVGTIDSRARVLFQQSTDHDLGHFDIGPTEPRSQPEIAALNNLGTQ
jgi:DNA-binding response OmpR family regulator